MATFLFDSVVFGPVNSRRLGVSLGINLLPTNRKLCSFDCLYCECGLNSKGKGIPSRLPSHEILARDLEIKLKEMVLHQEIPDVITFAGNGEPSMHPEFLPIIKTTLRLRDQYCPGAQVSVLSNSTRLHLPEVATALSLVDLNILKLDSAIENTVRILDRPEKTFNLEKTIQHLSEFEGELIIQTLFCRGEHKGEHFDNTTEPEVNTWLEALQKIRPSSVMIYSISRDTPIESIECVGHAELEQIAEKIKNIGLQVEIS